MPPKATRAITVLEEALQTLEGLTGIKGRVRPPAKRDAQDADAVVDLKAGHTAYRLPVRVKAAIQHIAALGPLRTWEQQLVGRGLIYTPHVTQTMAEECRRLDLPFLDGAGNVYLRLPDLFVFVTGRKPPKQAPRPNDAALVTATALRVAFLLMCRPELANEPYRQIAKTAAVALGAVGPALGDLRKRAYLYGKKGGRRLRDLERLLDEWTIQYPNHLRPKLNPRRFRTDGTAWWKDADPAVLDGVWGGEVAAHHLTRHLKPTTATLYLPHDQPRAVKELVRRHRWAVDPGGNIEVLEKFWNFPPEPDTPGIAPAPLVYADLVATLDPRNLETAEIDKEQFLRACDPA